MYYKKRFYLFIAALSSLMGLRAQDHHFADVQQMKQWYNQSLKMDRDNEFNVNYRDVKYQNMLAFKTGTVLVDAPLIKKENRTIDSDKGFLNLTAGASTEKSNSGLYKNTEGLLGVSYVQPISPNNMYMSVGFQGVYTSIALNNSGVFPDQMDQYGPIAGRISEDPLKDGKIYHYFSLNTGVSIFKRTDKVEWYLGGSVRDVNKPFTEETKSTLYKLPATWGAQSGVKFKSSTNTLDLYTMINWKAQANEYVVGIRYNFLLQNDQEQQAHDEPMSLGFGCAYRLRDAFIPNLSLNVNSVKIAFHYDMNTSGIRSNSFTRNGYELSLAKKF